LKIYIPNVRLRCLQRPRDDGDHDARDGGGHLGGGDADRDRGVRGTRTGRNRGGPKACDGWTAGLWVLTVTSFNRPGVQLAVTEQSVPTPAGLPSFLEAIITGPPSVLGAMDSPLPPDCRTIGGQPYPGGVRVISASPGPGSRHARAFEVTGTGKVPVWQWAEVVRGPDFLLEIRIPDQSAVADPFAALATITGSAYGRAAAVLSLAPISAQEVRGNVQVIS
jgi:hypothetical protein